MKRIIKSILIISILGLAFSCTIQKTTIPQAGINAQLNLELEDLEYIKDATGTSVQSYIAGLPIGGKKNKQVAVSNAAGSLLNVNLNSRGLNAAMFEALESVPDADFVLPISLEVVSDRMLLGREDSLIVKVKAFKLKVK